jgi:hypothetical protein
VDNAEARQSLNEVLKHNDGFEQPSFYWLDCGNVKNFGRVLLGTAAEVSLLRGAFSEKEGGTCRALPSPAMSYPDLLAPLPEEKPESSDVMSCAQRAAANLQSLNINAEMAVHANDFLTRLLVTQDLKKIETETNLRTGDAHSKYALPEVYAGVARKPDSYFVRRPGDDIASLGDATDAALGGGDPFIAMRL